jgi:hypothetical protein
MASSDTGGTADIDELLWKAHQGGTRCPAFQEFTFSRIVKFALAGFAVPEESGACTDGYQLTHGSA